MLQVTGSIFLTAIVMGLGFMIGREIYMTIRDLIIKAAAKAKI